MSIRLKLVIILLLVALVPLTVSALTALRVLTQAYDQKTAELHKTSADNLARIVEQRVTGQVSRVAAVARPLPWVELTGRELAGALTLVYQQSSDVVSVQLIDAAGAQRGSPIFVESKSETRNRSKLVVDVALVERIRNGALAAAKPRPPSVFTVAEAIAAPGVPYPILPVRIEVPAANESWTIVMGLYLASACNEVTASGDATSVIVADSKGRELCARASPLARVSRNLAANLSDGSGKQRFSYTDANGNKMVAAARKLGRGWWLVVQQSATTATQPRRDLRNQTILWIGASLVVALMAGLVLSGAITGPVRQLKLGAEEIARGNLDYRVPTSDKEGGDELVRLASTFNDMTAEIQQQNKEIQEWNETLQERVESRTRELKDAQGQLLQSQKLAAMNALAAGVAHEINNPLAGVLGLIQVLRMRTDESTDAKTAKILSRVETDAQRIRDIVSALLSLRDEQEGDKQNVVVAEVVHATVGLLKAQLEEARIAVRTELDESLEVRANAAQIRTALIHLISNSIAASDAGASIDLSVSDIEGQLVCVKVKDEGKGIEEEHLARVFEPFYTTKSEWRGRGLGLAMVHRIVEEHNGRVEVDSTVGVGTTVTIRLPRSAGGAHLT